MPNFAVLDGENIINIITSESKEIAEELTDKVCIEFTIESASPGGTYDGSKFWLPQPYPSWIKNEETNEWEAPIPYPVFDPENPRYYQWNEDILNWEEIQVSE